MNSDTHGFSMGIERYSDSYHLFIKAVGKLTHADYEKMMPLIDSVLSEVREPKVRAFIDIREFQGWEPRAAWDDFKIGLKYGNDFDRVAIVGNRNWQEKLTGIASWFVSGEVEFFTSKEEALSWLNP